MMWAKISSDRVTYIDPGLTDIIIGKKAYAEYLKPIIGKVNYEGSDYVKPRVAVYGNLAILTYKLE